MTTIAYRDGVLAGDSLITYGDTKLPGRERKVFKLRGGYLFGGCGATEQIDILKNSVTGEKVPELTEVTAILVTPEGVVRMYEGKAWVRDRSPYLAIGSGMSFALAAMWLGHDAKTAVKTGIMFDSASGGRVYSVSF